MKILNVVFKILQFLVLTTEKEIDTLAKDNHVQYCYLIYNYNVLNVKTLLFLGYNWWGGLAPVSLHIGDI